jgi:hypothetical protein
MGKRVKIEDAFRSGDPQQQKEFYDAIRKKAILWSLLTLIPGVHLFTSGLAILTRNEIRMLDGKQPGGFLNTITAFWGLIIFPLIVGKLVVSIRPWYEGALGVRKMLKDWHYED